MMFCKNEFGDLSTYMYLRMELFPHIFCTQGPISGFIPMLNLQLFRHSGLRTTKMQKLHNIGFNRRQFHAKVLHQIATLAQACTLPVVTLVVKCKVKPCLKKQQQCQYPQLATIKLAFRHEWTTFAHSMFLWNLTKTLWARNKCASTVLAQIWNGSFQKR